MPVFLPDLILPELTDLTSEMLISCGAELLMLDFDNTIVPYTTDIPTEQMRAWLKSMQASKIRLCVVSNTKKPRVQTFCREYGIELVMKAGKPFHRGIRECLSRFSLKPEQAALVGDQIYTDVLGANTAGLTSILVSAIHNHNIFLKLRHIAELPFILAGRARLRTREKKQENTGAESQKR